MKLSQARITDEIVQRLNDTASSVTLVSGAWGSGKTFLWDKMVLPRLVNETPIYVSLFGIRDPNEIGQKILSAFISRDMTDSSQGLAFQRTRLLATALNKTVKAAGLGPIADFAATVLSRLDHLAFLPSQLVICIDDVERISHNHINMREVLGVVEQLVGQHGHRVLLLANEEEIRGDDYPSFKERVIATTLFLSSGVEEFVSRSWASRLPPVIYRAALNAALDAGMENLRTVERYFRCVSSVARAAADRPVPTYVTRQLLGFVAESSSGSLDPEATYEEQGIHLLIRSRKPSEQTQARSKWETFLSTYLSTDKTDYVFIPEIYSLARFGILDDSALSDRLWPPETPPSPMDRLIEEIFSQQVGFYGTDDELAGLFQRALALLLSTDPYPVGQVARLLEFIEHGANIALVPPDADRLEARIIERFLDAGSAGDRSLSLDRYRHFGGEPPDLVSKGMAGYNRSLKYGSNSTRAADLSAALHSRDLGSIVKISHTSLDWFRPLLLNSVLRGNLQSARRSSPRFAHDVLGMILDCITDIRDNAEEVEAWLKLTDPAETDSATEAFRMRTLRERATKRGLCP